MREKVVQFIKELQQDIKEAISELDGTAFVEDRWDRQEGGEGISCVLQDGRIFEKAGVNISVVHGTLPPEALRQMRARGNDRIPTDASKPFFAAGISLVFHPHNPFVPTVHMNYRYFEVIVGQESQEAVWWFGGGSDLTPSYIEPEDILHFHSTLKEACDAHHPSFYPRFKKWCDDYFCITHRGERRGVGGIFFDDLDELGQEGGFQFIRSCGKAFLPSYVPLVKLRHLTAYDEEQKRWQQIRRGRYVEFNLVYDRGTKFGLATPGARIESILVSLPLTARWEYGVEVPPGSPESVLLDACRTPKDWLGIQNGAD